MAVGEDSDIWKWYGIKRKRLIEFMLITWDLEEKVFVKLRQGSGKGQARKVKERQGKARMAKGERP